MDELLPLPAHDNRHVGSARPKRARGFTLIELMVVLVIVGILGVIALPSFMNQIRKSRRAEAITELYRVSQAEERFRANNPTYSANLATGGANPLSLFTSATAASQYDMANGYYRISVAIGAAAAAATQYTVTAATRGGMTADATCNTLIMSTATNGSITYTSTTAGGQTNAAQSAANLSCWNRG